MRQTSKKIFQQFNTIYDQNITSLRIVILYLFTLNLLVSLNLNAEEMEFSSNCNGCLFGIVRIQDSVETMMQNSFLENYINSGVCSMINNTPNSRQDHCLKTTNTLENSRIVVPTSLHDIIYQEEDAPIYLIEELHTISQNYWQQFKIANLDKSSLLTYAGFDFLSLPERNLEAAKIWIRLVTCNSNNPVLARQAFYSSTEHTLCIDNETESLLLKTKISELAINFQLLIKGYSSYFLRLDILDNKHVQSFFKNMHPLLVEFLFLNWSALFNKKEGDSLLNIKQLGVRTMKFSIDNVEDEDIKPNTNLSTIQYAYKNFVQAVLLSISLLNYEGNQDTCSTYGLWPAINQSLVYYRPPFSTGSPFQSELFITELAVTKNCRSKHFLAVDAISAFNGVYGLYFDSILNNNRILYKYYFLPKN